MKLLYVDKQQSGLTMLALVFLLYIFYLFVEEILFFLYKNFNLVLHTETLRNLFQNKSCS